MQEAGISLCDIKVQHEMAGNGESTAVGSVGTAQLLQTHGHQMPLPPSFQSHHVLHWRDCSLAG